MSRFRFESNSAIPHTEPIDESEGGGDSDHDELSAMHARDKHSGKKKCEHGEKDFAAEAERISAGVFFAEHGKSSGDGAVDEEARDAGEQGVPAKIPGDGKYQEQHSKNHDGDMRRSKARMDLAEEGREIATLAHGKRDAWRVQDVGAEIATRGGKRGVEGKTGDVGGRTIIR